jgi:hypothetical protein
MLQEFVGVVVGVSDAGFLDGVCGRLVNVGMIIGDDRY